MLYRIEVVTSQAAESESLLSEDRGQRLGDRDSPSFRPEKGTWNVNLKGQAQS